MNLINKTLLFHNYKRQGRLQKWGIIKGIHNFQYHIYCLNNPKDSRYILENCKNVEKWIDEVSIDIAEEILKDETEDY